MGESTDKKSLYEFDMLLASYRFQIWTNLIYTERWGWDLNMRCCSQPMRMPVFAQPCSAAGHILCLGKESFATQASEAWISILVVILCNKNTIILDLYMKYGDDYGTSKHSDWIL